MCGGRNFGKIELQEINVQRTMEQPLVFKGKRINDSGKGDANVNNGKTQIKLLRQKLLKTLIIVIPQ